MIGTSTSQSLDPAMQVLASKNVLAAELGGEVSLLDVKSGVYFTLNAVGATVWRLVQNAKSLAELKQSLLEEYDVEPERCEQDLRHLVTELRSSGLVELIAA